MFEVYQDVVQAVIEIDVAHARVDNVVENHALYVTFSHLEFALLDGGFLVFAVVLF